MHTKVRCERNFTHKMVSKTQSQSHTMHPIHYADSVLTTDTENNPPTFSVYFKKHTDTNS